MIGRPEYTLALPPPCPTNRDHLRYTVFYNGLNVVSTDLGAAHDGAAHVVGMPAGTRLHARFSRPEYQGTVYGRGVDFYRSLDEIEGAGLGLGAGEFRVSVYTDFDNEEGGSDSTVDNYLTGGVWTYVPADPYRFYAYEVGAFAGGNDPFLQENLASVTETFDYIGNSFVHGFYTDAVNGIYKPFTADALLTAEFGGSGELGTIGGHIRNFVVDGQHITGYPDLVLHSTNIGSSCQWQSKTAHNWQPKTAHFEVGRSGADVLGLIPTVAKGLWRKVTARLPRGGRRPRTVAGPGVPSCGSCCPGC